VTENLLDKPRQGSAEILPPVAGEVDILRDIKAAQVAAGLVAFGEWRDRRSAGAELTNRDLVCAIYAAMLRSK
jgi:hypothetical protein